MIYNIYKFQENQRTKNRSLSLHFTHSLHFTLHFSQPALRFGLAGGGGRWREEVLGDDGFGTERARLAQGGSSAERARLAQGGFRGQFSKRNPFKRNF